MRAYKVIKCLISQPKHMFWVTYVLGTQKNRLNEGGERCRNAQKHFIIKTY